MCAGGVPSAVLEIRLCLLADDRGRGPRARLFTSVPCSPQPGPNMGRTSGRVSPGALVWSICSQLAPPERLHCAV